MRGSSRSALFDETAYSIDESTFQRRLPLQVAVVTAERVMAPLWADDSRIVFMLFEFFNRV